MPSSALAGVGQVWFGFVASSKFDCLVKTGVVALVNNQILSLENVVWKNVARTDVAWTNVAKTDVAMTNVAWTNATWSNGTGPLGNSQGWFYKLDMSSTVLFLGGWGGG